MKTQKSPFFFDIPDDPQEGIDVLVTKGANHEWAGRTLTITDDDGNTFRYLFYILPLDESSALVFCPFGEAEWLSGFVSALNKYNIEGAENAWPLLMAALKNGIDGNYSHDDAPALIPIDDTPTGESNIWGVAVKVENIDYEDIDTKYLYKKAITASQYALSMLMEYQENDISKTDVVLATGRKTFDAWRTAKNVAKVASLALAFFGVELPFGDD